MIGKLLEVRKEIKDRKPDFIRQDYGRRIRINAKWRKPKGIHSKIRHHFKGRRKMPSPGFKSPIKARGLHASGLKIVSVFSASDVERINKEIGGIVIAKSVGMKKKLEILKKAKELQIQVLNLNVDGQIKKIEEKLSSRKKTDAKSAKKPEEQKETKKAQAEEQLTDEQKKKLEKKEKDKILTKKA